MKFKVVILAAMLGLINALAGAVAPRPPHPVPAEAPGTTRATFWEGREHDYDAHFFRRLDGPIPAKTGRRIVAVGDSLTYGMGVGADEAWPARLAELTGVEVLNLGVSGYQSGQVAQLVRDLWGGANGDIVRGRRQYPRFRGDVAPDVVVYAACVNDAVDDGPLPWDMQWSYEMPSSRAGLVRFVAGRLPISHWMLTRHSDFGRLGRNVAAAVEAAQSHGVPLIVAVFDNFGWSDLVDPMEHAIEASGGHLVRFRLPAGNWNVSRWEAHPNAEAHRRFAEAIHGAL